MEAQLRQVEAVEADLAKAMFLVSEGQREYRQNILTIDRDTAYTLLREAITKKRLIEAAFPGSTITLDWKQGHNQALDDILTLLDHIYGKTDALTK